MRLGMRSYTIGSAWWQGDCGPYWGHNAIVRIAPFIAHCRLPVLTAGVLVKGHVLSHDQVEAVLMRSAGYEVRVLADRWTAVTADGSLAAHFEHTVAVTEHGPTVLTGDAEEAA